MTHYVNVSVTSGNNTLLTNGTGSGDMAKIACGKFNGNRPVKGQKYSITATAEGDPFSMDWEGVCTFSGETSEFREALKKTADKKMTAETSDEETLAQVDFSKTPIGNVTKNTLQINPWQCGAPIPPQGSEVVNCRSDGVLRHNADGSRDFYEWTNKRSINPGWAGVFNNCTDKNIFLTLTDGHDAEQQIILVADFKQHLPPQETAREIDLSQIELEEGKADFGSSYDALSFRFPGNTAVAAATIVNMGGPGVKYDLEIVDSEKSLSREISFSVAASANILGAEISGAASMLSRVDMKATSVALVCKQVIPLGYKQLDKAQLKMLPEAEKQMAEDPKEFYKRFGTHFVAEAAIGGQLTLVMTKDYQSLGEKFEASAEAKAKYSGFTGETKFKSALESFSSHGEARLEMEQTGWLGKMPDMDITELQKYVNDFPLNVQEAPDKAVFKVTLTPYVSIAGAAASKAFREALGSAFKNTDEFVEALNAYKDTLENVIYANGVGLGVEAELKQWESDLQNCIGELKLVWNKHRGELTLPPVASVYESKNLKSPKYCQDLIKKVLDRTPIISGATVYLEYMDGRIVSDYKKSYLGRVASEEYCPNVGGQGDKGIALRLSVAANPTAALRSGDVLSIETMEELPLDGKDYRWLSAFSDHYLYYYKSGYGKNQEWKIEKTSGGGTINYGDKVRLVNEFYDQQMAVTSADAGTGLTTVAKDKTIHWVIDKA